MSKNRKDFSSSVTIGVQQVKDGNKIEICIVDILQFVMSVDKEQDLSKILYSVNFQKNKGCAYKIYLQTVLSTLRRVTEQFFDVKYL